MLTINETICHELREYAQVEKQEFMHHFFRTGPGEYAEGDKILVVPVPIQRKIAKKYFKTIKQKELLKLLHSPWHEERLTALIILTYQFEKADEEERERIFNFYLKKTKYINNWDLVDCSAYKIVGVFLLKRNKNILYQLAQSKSLWERRIAVVATLEFIRQGEFTPTMKIAKMLLNDDHDLIHKAVGWMIREVGKREEKVLTNFLEKHSTQMPRTMLRYAIEKLENKKYYLNKK